MQLLVQSKIDNSLSNSDISIPCYYVLRCSRNRNGGGTAGYFRQDLSFNLRSTVTGNIDGIFLDILLLNPARVGLFGG